MTGLRRAAVRAGAAVLAVALTAALAAGCTTDGADGTEDPTTGPTSDGCVGERGDGYRLTQGGNHPLSPPGRAGIGATDMESDPVTVTLILGGPQVTAAEREAAIDLELDDTFAVGGTTYRVAQICAGVVEVAPA